MERGGLALVWAREKENGEYHPANLLEITADGSYHVTFIGWGKRHDVVLAPLCATSGTPSVLFDEPTRVRKPPPLTQASAVAAAPADAPTTTPPRAGHLEPRKRPREQLPATPPRRPPKKMLLCPCGTNRHEPNNNTNLSFNGAWVCCDECDRWVHGDCAGYTIKQAEKLDFYVCEICASAARDAILAPAAAPAAANPASADDPMSTEEEVEQKEEEEEDSSGHAVKVSVPLDIACAACTGTGRGDQMLRCHLGCGGWVHFGCAGLGEAGTRPQGASFACPECDAPPPWPPADTGRSPPTAAAPAAGHSKAPASDVDGKDALGDDRALLQALYDDRLMERDLRKHLRRLGLPTRRSLDLPGELRARLIEFLQGKLNPDAPSGASGATAATGAKVHEGANAAVDARETTAEPMDSELAAAVDSDGSGPAAAACGQSSDGGGTARLDARLHDLTPDSAGGPFRGSLSEACHDGVVPGGEGGESGEGGGEGPRALPHTACQRSSHCAACGELFEAGAGAAPSPAPHLDCDVCQCRMHVRCALGGANRAAGVGGRSRQRCCDCMAIAAAVAVASARRTGWAGSDLFTDAAALRRSAAQLSDEAGAAVASQAAEAALRERKRAIGQRAPPRVVCARAYWAARRTADRLRRGLNAAPDVAGGVPHADADADAGHCRRVLEGGGGELFFLTLSHIDDTSTLRAAACACRAWSQLLDRSRSDEAAALWRSAWLSAPRGKLTLAAAIRSTRPGDRLRIAAGTHGGTLVIPHALEVVGEPGAVLTGPMTLGGGGMARAPPPPPPPNSSSGSGGGGGSGTGGTGGTGGRGGGGFATATEGRRGVLRGIRFEHFYETAVTVLAGRWAVEDCEIASSRAPNRACVGVVLRGGAAVDVRGCTISGCSAAVLLSSSLARLYARDTDFANTRAAIEALRAGCLDVQGCRFDATHGGDVGMRLAADTAGIVCQNTVRGDESYLWGRVIPPRMVQISQEQGGQASEDAHEWQGVGNGAPLG